MNGSARSSAAYAATVNVVTNGSVTPRVTGNRCGLVGVAAAAARCNRVGGRRRGLPRRDLEAPALLQRILAVGRGSALGVVIRLVDLVEQPAVLPVADREGHHENGDAGDKAAAQLVEVLDEAQPILVADRAQASQRAP